MRKNDRPAPKARKERLVVKELAKETLVYDEDNHKAHCLNPTAAIVWKFCDGRTSVPMMTRRLEKELSAAIPEQMVWLAIRRLEESRLLEAPVANPDWIPQTSRRELVRRLGIAAVALPIITSIQAPAAAQAATCVPLNGTCTGAGQGNCCAGLLCSNSICINNAG